MRALPLLALLAAPALAAQVAAPDSLADRYAAETAQADSLRGAGRYAEAAQRYADAFALVRAPSSSALYAATRSAALAGRVGRAYGFLHRAIEAGWENTLHLGRDPDLAALRAYPDLWTEALAAVERATVRRYGSSYDPALAATLREVHRTDQGGRWRWRDTLRAYGGTVPDSVRTAFWDGQTAIDEANAALVDSVVAAAGWPGRSTVGEEGALAAFLVIQHAPLDVQERYLPTLAAAVAEGEAEPWHLAYLTDRVLWRTDRPQRYGSQYRTDPETGERSYEPIEDVSQLNARRAAIGMPPLDGYPPADG